MMSQSNAKVSEQTGLDALKDRLQRDISFTGLLKQVDAGFDIQRSTYGTEAVLRCKISVPNVNTGRVGPIHMTRMFSLYPGLSYEQWVNYIYRCFSELLRHELAESFLLSGRNFEDPHPVDR